MEEVHRQLRTVHQYLMQMKVLFQPIVEVVVILATVQLTVVILKLAVDQKLNNIDIIRAIVLLDMNVNLELNREASCTANICTIQVLHRSNINRSSTCVGLSPFHSTLKEDKELLLCFKTAYKVESLQ